MVAALYSRSPDCEARIVQMPSFCCVETLTFGPETTEQIVGVKEDNETAKPLEAETVKS